MKTEEKKSRPKSRVRLDAVEVAIWGNGGEDESWDKLTVTRSYKDAQGNYRTSNSFNRSQAILLRQALAEAIAEMDR